MKKLTILIAAMLVFVFSALAQTPQAPTTTLKVGDVAGVARDARLGLERMIERYDDPETPYRALRRASFANAYEYDDFAHLARVGEWSAGDDGEG